MSIEMTITENSYNVVKSTEVSSVDQLLLYDGENSLGESIPYIRPPNSILIVDSDGNLGFVEVKSNDAISLLDNFDFDIKNMLETTYSDDVGVIIITYSGTRSVPLENLDLNYPQIIHTISSVNGDIGDVDISSDDISSLTSDIDSINLELDNVINDIEETKLDINSSLDSITSTSQSIPDAGSHIDNFKSLVDIYGINLISQMIDDYLTGNLVEEEPVIPMRRYFNPNKTSYIDISEAFIRTGDYVSCKFLAPTEVSSRMCIFGAKVWSNAITLEFLETGYYGVSSRINCFVDDVKVTGVDQYPIDGKVHDLKIVGTSFGVVARLHNRPDNQFPSSIPIWDVSIVGSDQGNFFYPLDDDETESNSIRETIQNKSAILYPGSTSYWYDDIIYE